MRNDACTAQRVAGSTRLRHRTCLCLASTALARHLEACGRLKKNTVLSAGRRTRGPLTVYVCTSGRSAARAWSPCRCGCCWCSSAHRLVPAHLAGPRPRQWTRSMTNGSGIQMHAATTCWPVKCHLGSPSGTPPTSPPPCDPVPPPPPTKRFAPSQKLLRRRAHLCRA